MGRKRNTQNEKLPPYVYLAKGRYILRAYFNGKLGKEKRLCNGDASLSEVWAAYEAVTGKEQNTLRWLFSEFLDSSQFRQMAPKTQKEMDRQSFAICKRRLKDGREFGDLLLTEFTPGLIRKYLDNRGKEAPVAANREIALISIAFSWGRERDLCKDNPCYGVKRNKEKARTRYITDVEYELVYNLALKISPHYVPIAMEIAFLCRARRKEILSLEKTAILEEGLFIQRAKKSNSHIIGWSIRLRKAVQDCLDLAESINSRNRYLLTNRSGNKLTKMTFSTAWQRLMTKAQEEGLEERFTFHDLKQEFMEFATINPIKRRNNGILRPYFLQDPTFDFPSERSQNFFLSAVGLLDHAFRPPFSRKPYEAGMQSMQLLHCRLCRQL